MIRYMELDSKTNVYCNPSEYYLLVAQSIHKIDYGTALQNHGAKARPPNGLAISVHARANARAYSSTLDRRITHIDSRFVRRRRQMIDDR